MPPVDASSCDYLPVIRLDHARLGGLASQPHRRMRRAGNLGAPDRIAVRKGESNAGGRACSIIVCVSMSYSNPASGRTTFHLHRRHIEAPSSRRPSSRCSWLRESSNFSGGSDTSRVWRPVAGSKRAANARALDVGGRRGWGVAGNTDPGRPIARRRVSAGIPRRRSGGRAKVQRLNAKVSTDFGDFTGVLKTKRVPAGARQCVREPRAVRPRRQVLDAAPAGPLSHGRGRIIPPRKR